MDNGTMVESFKFLNYCQLAKNSLASKRFRDVIRTHRHKLALLYVTSIEMDKWCFNHLKPSFRIFGKDLSSEEYNEWIVRNGYSNQIPLECQVAEMESTEDERELYELKGCFKVFAHDSPKLEPETNVFYVYEYGALYATVFHAFAEVNHENWPLFEHFIRLLTDPFIYVESMELTAQNDILHLLTEAMNPDRNRLQCERLSFDLEDNVPKFISWIKDHVRCDAFHVSGYNDSNELNYDKELLDLFLTGANCSSGVYVTLSDSFPKIVDNFVQKFMDLKQCDEYQLVKSVAKVRIDVKYGSIAELKKKYAKFIVKEEDKKKAKYDYTPVYTFEFVNNNIGKKLKLNTHIFEDPGYHLYCCVLNL